MTNIQLAPLQGFTEAFIRNSIAECFGGISEFYTPFVRLEKGSFRNKELKDIDPLRNNVPELIPQIIAASGEEAAILVRKIASLGYRMIDINMGCPFPMMVRRGRGSGILESPERVADVLSVVSEFPDISFSVKLRLGWDTSDACLRLAGLLASLPLRQVVLHPRMGIQQYKGVCDLEAFARFYDVCRNPLVYNGDITTPEQMDELLSRFPGLRGLMIGRGLLARPWMASEYLEGASWSSSRKRMAFTDFHERLLAGYRCTIEGGDSQLLSKLLSFWEYFLNGADSRKLKRIRKAGNIRNYCSAVSDLIHTL